MSNRPPDLDTAITGALDEVVDLVHAGSSPTDAVHKVASERGFPAPYVNLMANAFNIGRFEAQRQSSDDPLVKAAEFDLVDAAGVLDRMFPPSVKTAAAIHHATAVSPMYNRPPDFLKRREKTARPEVDIRMVDKPPEPYPREPGHQIKAAFATIDRLKLDWEESRRSARASLDQVRSAFTKFAEALKAPGVSVREVEENCRIADPDFATEVFGEFFQRWPDMAKQASSTLPPRPVDWTRGLYGAFLLLKRAGDRFLTAKKAFEALDGVKEKEVEDLLRPFVPAVQERGVLPSSSSEKRASFLGGMFGTLAGSSLGRGLGGGIAKSTDAMQNSTLNKVTDPQHEATLRNIQTEAMLTDLMANDEVISGYDPNEVIGHFNEISQLSPRAANQTAVMRSLLRRRLQQGAFDPFETDLLLKIDQGLRGRDGPASGVLANGPSGVL